MNHTQANILQGQFPILANEDLTGKEGYLCTVIDASNTPKAALPGNIADLAVYMVHDGGASGARVSILPIEPGKAYRVKLKDTCVPGDRLVLAAVSTAADKGKVRKQPTANGTYRCLFLAEEKGVDGQFVQARAVVLEPVTISG